MRGRPARQNQWSVAIPAAVLALAMNGSVPAGAEAAEASSSDCKFVPTSKRVETFETGFYNTTWSSAWIEGATEGFGDGLSGESRLADFVRQLVLRPNETSEEIRQSLPWSRPPFCRRYEASPERVARLVSGILPQMGQDVLVSDVKAGVFLTDFGSYEHAAAAWKDRYLISVDPDGTGGSIVRVLRTVYISRTPGVFNRAASAGRNETWLLTKVSDGLAPAGP